MTETEYFEHLLDLPNVIGVEYDVGTVRAFVTGKVSEVDLDDADIVANNVDEESDVEEIGDLSQSNSLPDGEGERHIRHRPVESGVSEANINGGVGTAGPYPVTVTDTSKGVWADGVSEGDTVRLSNNHVYARSDKANLGEPIVQPSSSDGGTAVDRVGELVGYVPLTDGVTVDLAARTVTEADESGKPHQLDNRWPSAIVRDGYGDLKGATVVKTGRTTGTARARVKATSASVRVDYGKGKGPITLRDQIITGQLSERGDSGSPVFVAETGELLGELYTGTSKATILYKAVNMEQEFGVEL
ncbi:hypothetical protein [Halorussus sp. MSC15.2]|uniref:hypothetical protein n=1 Tax=Halorussus sp. MSC15.2 TaxID=2283638 RepID=UPI0013D62108|nr:hypothetical protein [Halorussus sp. MSC15.2]NEU58615.1 hypothetical protein [Halorussus sp. MSC15.2]